MKKRFAHLALATALVLFATSAAKASDDAAASQSKDNSIDVKMAITTRLVTLPDAPAFTAKGSGALNYKIGKEAAVIKGESIPKMIFEAGKPPAELKHLTITAEGIPGTTSTVNWKDYPKVTLAPVDLRVKAYEAKASEITASTPTLADITLSDIALSTEEISVEGWTSKGYIDIDKLEAQLVGKAILPEDEYKPYKEHLAGKPVIVELVVTIDNPYEKKK